MPSPAKHAALEAHGFRLPRVCATCTHWDPHGSLRGPAWGTCSKIRYTHEKHSAPSMHAGVPEYGTCNDHELDQDALTIAVGDDYARRYAEGL